MLGKVIFEFWIFFFSKIKGFVLSIYKKYFMYLRKLKFY